ncbi:MAG: hypothetical protein R3F36_00475 [Candidatus Competibacteraceae bacterium]
MQTDRTLDARRLLLDSAARRRALAAPQRQRRLPAEYIRQVDGLEIRT